MTAEKLIWILPMVGVLVVLIGAIYLNLTRPTKHEDVDALAEQAAERAERERARVNQINAQEIARRSQRAVYGEWAR